MQLAGSEGSNLLSYRLDIPPLGRNETDTVGKVGWRGAWSMVAFLAFFVLVAEGWGLSSGEGEAAHNSQSVTQPEAAPNSQSVTQRAAVRDLSPLPMTEEQSCSSPRTPRRTRTLASGKALPPPACPLLHARHARRSAPCPQAHAQPKASCLGAGASALALAMRLRGPLHPRDPPMAGHRCLHGGHLATFYSTPTAPRGVHRPASPHSILDSAARRDEDFSLVDPRAHSRCG